MEILIVLIVLIVLLLIFGVSVEIILLGLMGLMILMMLALTVFFTVCVLRIVHSEKVTGQVSQVKTHPKFGYGIPCYKVEGEEYENVFPCEMVMRKQLYSVGRECRVYLDKKHRKVYDGNATLSSAVGVVLSLGSFAMLLMLTLNWFGGAHISLMR